MIGYLILPMIEKLLIVFKMFFSAQKWVAQFCSQLPFGVGYYVCLGPTVDANVGSPAVFCPS